MRTRSGKQLKNPSEAPKRKRKSVTKPEQLPDGEATEAQQPLRKRQKKGPTHTTTSHSNDAATAAIVENLAPIKTSPVQSASQSNASILSNDSNTTRQIPGPSVENLSNIIREVSLGSYTCSTVRNYLQSRSRAFRKLSQKDAEHKAHLVIQELKNLGVITDQDNVTHHEPGNILDGTTYEVRQGFSDMDDDDDDDDDSRYAIGRRQVGERKTNRPAVMKPSAELILQEKEEQEDDSDETISCAGASDSRSISTRPKRAKRPWVMLNPLEHELKKKKLQSPRNSSSADRITRVISKESDKTEARNIGVAREQSAKNKTPAYKQNESNEEEERVSAMVKKAKSMSRTTRGHVMFTVSEAIQFLADFDENTASTSAIADEIEVGDFLQNPVRKPYHLGAMGRYGKETVVPDTKHMDATTVPFSAARVSHYGLDGSVDDPITIPPPQPTPFLQASRHNKYRMLTGPYAGYTFKSVPHSYLRLLQANPTEFDQYEGLREVFDSCWPTGMPDPSPVTYRFSFGPHLGRRLDDVPEEYRRELEASEEVKHPKSRQFKNLAAALKFWNSKDDSLDDVAASRSLPNTANNDTNTAMISTAESNARRNPKTYRGHKPFVFQHGRWAGVNIDTVPKHYLLQLQEHPDELAKHDGLAEILQLRFPDGLRTQINYKLKSGPHAGKTLDQVPDEYVVELDKTATGKSLKRALKYYFKEKEKEKEKEEKEGGEVGV